MHVQPCAFIAAEYVLLGRLARYTQTDKYLLVTPRRITITFISSDITTFLIQVSQKVVKYCQRLTLSQACGGALSISANNQPLAKAGSRVFLTGLALQLLSFFIFTCIFLVFLYRVRKYEPAIYVMDEGRKKWYQDWRALAGALLFSCIGILVSQVSNNLIVV